MNTLLCNGNAGAEESGSAILQGVYDKEGTVVYLTDVLVWMEKKFLDVAAETRLSFLVNLLKENPLLDELLVGVNEVRFRMPQIMECSKASLEHAYYGLYTRVNEPGFADEYSKLLAAACTSRLKISQDQLHTSMAACLALALDSGHGYYLKNGLAFVQRSAAYCLGQNEFILQWKDRWVSQRFGSLTRQPMLAHLCYDREKVLETHDGYTVAKTDERIQKLKTGEMYVFSYEGVELKGSHGVLEGMKYVGPSGKTVWSSMTRLLFKAMVQKGLLPFHEILSETERQEAFFKDLVNVR
eukprot:TRINITY_DN4882_c0_g5_i2.p1 TRINITY_DN4882_c0_g5~~TRINITY_DN4882_c0_g5_i2.p1  ORF type:complete len:298 (+),score=81.08 TRINITY_DN4882_c0_g5_i2:498-1391(+)